LILQNKRDRESWVREKTIESLKANTYLLENDIVLVAETNNFYKVVSEVTDIPLQKELYAKVMTSDIVGNSTSADKLKTPRTISLTGDVSGSTNFDGSVNVSINSTVANDSHTHSNSTITSLDASKITSGTIDIARLPAGALERCIVVADDAERFKLTSSQVQQGDTVKVTATNKMYFVTDVSKLNVEDGYVVYTAGSATEVPWSGVTGKPNNYPPSSHTHTKGQITDFPTSLKNPTAITIQANGTSLGSYDGSSAKTFNITASNVGAYTKEETNNLLNNKVDKVTSINVGNGLIGGGTLESNVSINMDYASSLEIEELLNNNLIKEVLELATEQDIRNLFVGTKLESSPTYNLLSLSTDESKVVNMRLLSLFNDLLLQRVKDNVNVMIGPKVDSSLNLIAGKGLVGGGTLESNVTFSLDYATTSEIEGILK